MKRFLMILLLLLVCAVTYAHAASIADILSAHGNIISSAANENHAAAFYTADTPYTYRLVTFTKTDETWLQDDGEASVCITAAAYDDFVLSWLYEVDTCRVSLTDDDFLLISFSAQDNTFDVTMHYKWFDGQWTLDRIIEENSFSSYSANCSDRWITYFTDGLLHTDYELIDDTGKLLIHRKAQTLPEIITVEEKRLSSLQSACMLLSGHGYNTDESSSLPDEVIRRLCSALIPDGYTYIRGRYTGGGLQFLCDKDDHTRVLLCVLYTQNGWSVTESTALPSGTCFGIENALDYLCIGSSHGTPYGVHIAWNGISWGIDAVFGAEDFNVASSFIGSPL